MFFFPLYLSLTRLVPATSIHRALSRFFSQVLCMGLSAISFPIRQILRHANHRIHSRAEVKQSRLHCFREHRSHQHWRGGTHISALGHWGYPFSWISSPFPLEYACTHHTTPYSSKHLPQLETRSFHPWHTCPPFTQAVTKSSCRRRIRIKRGRRQKGLSIQRMRTLLNPHPHSQVMMKSLSLLAKSWSPVPRHFIQQWVYSLPMHASLPLYLMQIPLLSNHNVWTFQWTHWSLCWSFHTKARTIPASIFQWCGRRNPHIKCMNLNFRAATRNNDTSTAMSQCTASWGSGVSTRSQSKDKKSWGLSVNSGLEVLAESEELCLDQENHPPKLKFSQIQKWVKS